MSELVKFEVPAFIREQIAANCDSRAAEEIERAEQEKLQAAEGERKRQASERAFVATGTPPRVRDLVIAGLHDSPALKRVKDWEMGRKRYDWCLALSSRKGTGKSVAAGWWLWQSGRSAARSRDNRPMHRWWHATDLACLDWYGGEFDDVARMEGPLVIDDLGTEFNDAKGFFHQRLDKLINVRYEEGFPTLITSNLSAKDFKERYGERVTDRFREGGAFYEFTAPSLRGRNPVKAVGT